MPKPANPAPKKRTSGAQPENWNAFKHGFYSRRFRPPELSDLSTALGDGLQDEIALLRVIIRRVFDLASDSDKQDLSVWSRSLDTLGAAATRLAGLLRTQQVLGGDQTSALEALGQALGVAAHELGWTDPTKR